MPIDRIPSAGIESGGVAPSNLSTGAPTWNTSGDVGIGTSSPASRLHVNAAAGTSSIISLTATTGNGGIIQLAGNANTLGTSSFDILQGGDGTAFVYSRASGAPLVFGTANTERARIDSSGNLMVDQTLSTDARTYLRSTSDTFNALCVDRASSSNGIAVRMRRNGSTVGSIDVTTTATSYVTSSDYRLKEDVQPMTGALAKVQALKPVTYKWKADGSDGQGFIAHELQEVVPECVTGEKDAVDDEGNIKPQGIDTSFLVATLTAAIQEQQQMIETLQAKVAALEAK